MKAYLMYLIDCIRGEQQNVYQLSDIIWVFSPSGDMVSGLSSLQGIFFLLPHLFVSSLLFLELLFLELLEFHLLVSKFLFH